MDCWVDDVSLTVNINLVCGVVVPQPLYKGPNKLEWLEESQLQEFLDRGKGTKEVRAPCMESGFMISQKECSCSVG